MRARAISLPLLSSACILAISCARQADDAVRVPSAGSATTADIRGCPWYGSGSVVFSDLARNEETGDYSGSEFVLTQDTGNWSGTYQTGEGSLHPQIALEQLVVQPVAARIAFQVPASLENAAIKYSGTLFCDSLVVTLTISGRQFSATYPRRTQ